MTDALAPSPIAAPTAAPRIETARLILRGPEMADLDAFAAFHADETRCTGFGPVQPWHESWRWWVMNIGHWHVHGYGYFTVWERASGRPAGICGIWNPEGWPEPEIGWALFAEFEGRGIARRAALAARAWAYDSLGMPALTSNIKPGNLRSRALATRLGAHHECSYDNPEMGEEELELDAGDLSHGYEPVEGLTAGDIKSYIRFIADRRPSQLGLQPIYRIDAHPLPWLDTMLNAVEHANFFENRATENSRAAIQGSWDESVR